MGRHVDPEDDSFRRSLLRAVAGGVAAMVVTFAVVAALTMIGRDDGSGGPAVVLTEPATSPTPSPTASPTPSPTPTPEPTEASPTPEATDEPTDAATPRPPAEVTVQVLAAGGTEEQMLEAAEVLRDLGYQVVAVQESNRTVDTTRVLATAGAEDEGEALGTTDERFGPVEPNDGFNPGVDLHVLVGPDFGV